MVLLSDAVRAALEELRRRCGERFGGRVRDVVLFGMAPFEQVLRVRGSGWSRRDRFGG